MTCAASEDSDQPEHSHSLIRVFADHIEGWAQDWRKSDGCFSPNLISSPWRRYVDYNISFCKQWKFMCHCSYEQWHLNLHCLQRGPSCPLTRVLKICLSYHSLALNPRHVPSTASRLSKEIKARILALHGWCIDWSFWWFHRSYCRCCRAVSYLFLFCPLKCSIHSSR